MDIFRKERCQILEAEIRSLHAKLDEQALKINSLKEENARLKESETKCFVDGDKCGWHNADLKSGRCPISAKELVLVSKGIARFYSRGRMSGSQYVAQLERKSMAEGE